MNQEQSASIVDFVAAADNRTVSEDTYAAWHLIIGHLPFETAREGALMALQDENIRWVEPKTILAKVSRLRDLQDQEARRARAIAGPAEKKSEGQPICLAHGLKILNCPPCCAKANELADRLGGHESRAYQNQFFVEIARPGSPTQDVF